MGAFFALSEQTWSPVIMCKGLCQRLKSLPDMQNSTWKTLIENRLVAESYCCIKQWLTGSTAYVSPVAKGRVEGPSLWVEQVPDVTEAGDFKNLRLLLDNLSAQVKTHSSQSKRLSGQVFVSLHTFIYFIQCISVYWIPLWCGCQQYITLIFKLYTHSAELWFF